MSGSITLNFTDDNFTALADRAAALRNPNTGTLFTSANEALAYIVAIGLQRDANTSNGSTGLTTLQRAKEASANNYNTALAQAPDAQMGIAWSSSLYDFGSIAASSSGTDSITISGISALPVIYGTTCVFSYTAPSGITLSFSPSSGTLPVTTTATCHVGGGVQNGVYFIAIFGTVGTLVSKVMAKVTVTGGVSTGTTTNGPFTATQHAAMTHGLTYNFTYTYTPPAGVNINRWAIWLSRTQLDNTVTVIPILNSCAFDVWPWNTQQIHMFEANGLASVDLAVGASATFTNGLWSVPMVGATLVDVSGTLTLSIPNIVFNAAGNYELFMLANYSNGDGQFSEQDAAGSVWFDMGPYIVT